VYNIHILRGKLVSVTHSTNGATGDPRAFNMAFGRAFCPAHDRFTFRQFQVGAIMTRIIEQETYDNDPIFEPNRARRKDKFKKEREEEKPEENHKNWKR